MNQRILIVENEHDIADVMRRYLEFEGFEVGCALTLDAARSFCVDEPPDLIVLDWHLPDAEGDEWLDELRAHDTTADIPVIMMTGGYPTPRLLARLSVTHTPLLIKPFSLDQLVGDIRHKIERERALGVA
jgi:DNA-binding response OmpR family regulator